MFHDRRSSVCALWLTLAAGPAFADELVTNEWRITSSPAHETTPTLGNDATSDLVVYTQQATRGGGTVGAGDIWYRPLVGGAPAGRAVRVTAGDTDDQLNDVSGDYIVYTSFDDTSSSRGTIVAHQISTATQTSLGTAEIIREAKILGDRVVWRQGAADQTVIMVVSLAGLAHGETPRPLAGWPDAPVFDVQIGSRFVVWAELTSAGVPPRYDIRAYDFDAMLYLDVTDTPDSTERRPATSGSWIVWEQNDGTAVTVEAYNANSNERVTLTSGGGNFNPSIDGDLVAWETDVAGNLDVWVHRLSIAESYAVTTSPEDEYLNDVFGSLVAYVSQTGGSEDVYVTRLEFVAEDPDTVVLDFDYDAGGEWVPAGSIAGEQWAELGVHLTCYNDYPCHPTCHTHRACHPDACLVFDSSSPTGGDFDLGSPHRDFRGPGRGWGGAAGMPGENADSLFNVIIIAEDVKDIDGDGLVDDPDDEAAGGKVHLTFDEPVDLSTVQIVDIDAFECGTAIVVTDVEGEITLVSVPGLGNNSVQDVAVDVPSAVEMTVHFAGSGALAEVVYTPTVMPQVDNEAVFLVRDPVVSTTGCAAAPGVGGAAVAILFFRRRRRG